MSLVMTADSQDSLSWSHAVQNAGRFGVARLRAEHRDLIESIPTVAWTALPDGSVEFVNRHWREYSGLSAEDSAGSGWRTAVHPEDLDRYTDKWLASLASGAPFESEVRYRRAADEQYRWFLVRAAPLRDEQGKILTWCGISTEIDDHKRAEALLAGEKRILEMLARGGSLAQILDSLCRLAEQQAPDVLASILLLEGERLRHGAAPNLPQAYTDAIDGVVIGPHVGSCGTAAYTGKQVIVSDIANDPLWANYREAALPHSLRACWSTPIFSSERKVIGTFAMYYRTPRGPSRRDQELIEQITHLAGVAIQRKLSEEALGKNERQFRALFDQAAVGIALVSLAGRPFESNRKVLEMLGCSSEEFHKQHFEASTHPDDLERDLQLFAELVGGGRDHYQIGKRYYRRDGGMVSANLTVSLVRNESNEPLFAIAITEDITDRKRAEDELRASEELKRRIIESSRDCIKVLDLDGNLLFMSSGGQQLLEIDNIQPYLNSCWIEFWKPEDRPMISEAVAAARAGGIGTFQAYCPSAKGSPRWWDVITTPICNADGRPEQLLSVSRDITEGKRAEAEARESERRYREMHMELARASRAATMGQLTASIAHEVKQPIAATVSNAQAALRWLAHEPPELDEVRQTLARMLKDGIRAGEVLDRIRDLIRKTPPRKDRLGINDAIREVIELTRGEAAKHGVRLQAQLADSLPLIEGDRVQLQQVILNLMVNALEAMSGSDEGTRELRISTETDAGGGVLVTVRDTGPGLAPETSEQLFEPFYTTKPSGLGLGLSICRSIVESHGGRLWASTNVPHGAKFEFTLPAQ